MDAALWGTLKILRLTLTQNMSTWRLPLGLLIIKIFTQLPNGPGTRGGTALVWGLYFSGPSQSAPLRHVASRETEVWARGENMELFPFWKTEINFLI